MARIRIDDLPLAERLTPQQEELILGAGLRSFRPSLEGLEARQLLSANPVTLPVLPSGTTALVQQAASQMQIDYNTAFARAAAPQVQVQNGVADITQAARATLESDILARLPKTLGSYPLIGEVKLDGVKLDRLTLDKDGNFNGQLTATFKATSMSATVTAYIENNQLRLDSDNALVRQFGKLEQRQKEWQPKVTEALDAIRPGLMAQYFGTQAAATGGR
jgi:hypothetical protein